ncbi:MAG: carotenoid oxygenase family protein [Alphaproteobacteria bacterium]
MTSNPASASPQIQFPPAPAGPGPTPFGAGGAAGGGTHRLEGDLFDCEVEGKIPADLDGAFYRVGPDPQYPKDAKWQFDIPFDGEGHTSMFRIKNGHVDFKSRWVRTQRWKAQHAARRSLFGIYRNPYTNDPSVKSVSGGTANTQMWFHHGKLFALKEDSPPVAMNPLTLETTDDYYTFGGTMESLTFTAHPKTDSETGELLAFGYEAKGLYSTDIEVFSVGNDGKVNWSAWVKAPYCAMIHDYAITDKHVALWITPLAANEELLKKGGPHWFWDSTLPSYLGVMRRGGDGSDIHWIKGPAFMATHTMGCWSDGHRLYIDVDGAPRNQFPFFPNIHEFNDPKTAFQGNVYRMSVDLSTKAPNSFSFDMMYPEAPGGLSRQDDRYHTVKYRYGFLYGGVRWMKIDHQTGKVSSFFAGDGSTLNEMCFAPRNAKAGEGDGYLVGIATRHKEGGRSDLVIVDTQNMEAGPVATVKMPYRVPGQIHGFWVSGDQLPSN